VLKLGGHLLFDEDINTEVLAKYAELLKRCYDGGRWVVVVGGGSLARKYINAARKLGFDEASCDEIAVRVTRVHAYLLAKALDNVAVQRIPVSLDEITELSNTGRVVVVGGLQPGQSTLAVSALTASAIKAERVVVATDVDGIYTDDPKKNPEAKLIPRMSFQQLAEMARNVSQKAGEYKIVDAVGLAMVLRTHIPLYYVNGFHLNRVEDALFGRTAGTIVSD